MNIRIILISLLLTGCSYDIDSWEFKAANDFCSDKGGVSYMEAYGTTGRWYLICQDSSNTVLATKNNS